MREKVWSVLVVLSLGTAGVLTGVLVKLLSNYGPWWLWASDACPNDPNAICGMIPVGPFLAVAPVVFLLGVWFRLLPAPEGA